MLTIPVKIQQSNLKNYNIYIGNSLLTDNTIATLLPPKKNIVIADEKALAYHHEKLPKNLHRNIYVVKNAEKAKNLSEIEKIAQWALEKGIDRSSTTICFGGGAIGDLGGFFAATYMRGIPFVQIPTTLLAQVDASVGGKTAVNVSRAKNMIGCFHQPQAVFVDISLLNTLPKRELLSGAAEAMKMGVIGDEELFSLFDASQEISANSPSLTKIIERSVRLKMQIVSEDEKECGKRMWLNLGHTTGHALESITNYSKYLHGEAVAFGCIVAANIATELKICDDITRKKISHSFQKIIASSNFSNINIDHLLLAMRYDKKCTEGKIRFIVPQKIGSVTICDHICDDVVKQAIVKTLENLENA